MLKKLVIILSLIVFQHNINANCPVYNNIFIDNNWVSIDNWKNFPSYLKGSFSGLHKVIINRSPGKDSISCFYSSLGSNAHQVYRVTKVTDVLSLDNSNWQKLSENHYSCEPLDSTAASNCNFD